MNDKFKETFNKLSIDEKRNALSNELLIIASLLHNVENNFGINRNFNIKNYDPQNDSTKDEDEMLDFFYEDVYNIEKELLLVIDLINKQ